MYLIKYQVVLPFVRKSRYTSADCFYRGTRPGHEHSQTYHTQWWVAVDLSAWLPEQNKKRKEKEILVQRGETNSEIKAKKKMKELPWESFSLFLHHNSYFLYRCVQLPLLGQFYRQPSKIQMVIWPAHKSYILKNKQYYCYELDIFFGKGWRKKD